MWTEEEWKSIKKAQEAGVQAMINFQNALRQYSETPAPEARQNPYISSSALYDTQTPDASDGGDEKPHWVFRFEE